MIFTSFDFVFFLIMLYAIYWIAGRKKIQNPILLVAGYIFYGWITPWFCILLFISSMIDYFIGRGMRAIEETGTTKLKVGAFSISKKGLLVLSLISNLTFLGFFKYFNFFVENVASALSSIGFHPHVTTLQIILPVGISFYTFQSLAYILDVYWGKFQARRNIVDYMLFVSFFPQLVAGPIERAPHMLPQIERERKFSWSQFSFAIPFLVRGFLKKLVIADNVAIYADKVFMLDHPTVFMLIAGALAFTIQIYADFSAYTDIARGSATLFGFNLIKNFEHPYLAISPSDFWRRWHISFSSWIRDYLYIPLGGSKKVTMFGYGMVLIISMGLSGFWHGASWHFVFWGLYYAVLIFMYRALGFGGKWHPQTKPGTVVAWFIMMCFTVFGWILFRTPDMQWLANVFKQAVAGFSGDSLVVGLDIIAFVILYSIPLFLFMLLDKVVDNRWIHATVYGLSIVALMIFFRDAGRDFIYFHF